MWVQFVLFRLENNKIYGQTVSVIEVSQLSLRYFSEERKHHAKMLVGIGN